MPFLSFLIKLIVAVGSLPECQEFRYDRGDTSRLCGTCRILVGFIDKTLLRVLIFPSIILVGKTKKCEQRSNFSFKLTLGECSRKVGSPFKRCP